MYAYFLRWLLNEHAKQLEVNLYYRALTNTSLQSMKFYISLERFKEIIKSSELQWAGSEMHYHACNHMSKIGRK